MIPLVGSTHDNVIKIKPFKKISMPANLSLHRQLAAVKSAVKGGSKIGLHSSN